MKSVNFLIKPASSSCNMRCRYCFYTDEAAARTVAQTGHMTQTCVDSLIQAAFTEAERGGRVNFFFQGGEPLLAGLHFFQYFIQQVRAARPRDITVQYAIQTNALTINDAWAEFFSENQFLVGVSVDGIKDIHDLQRIDAAEKGTWNRVIAALRCLKKHNVEVNLLCVVSAPIARSPHKVYSNLKKLGLRHLQFIACLDPLELPRGSMPWSLTPQAYGRFLCGVFDEYHRDWLAGCYTSVRLFDDYIHMAMGLPPSTCATSGSCGVYFVVEGDGSVYPCDFYALDAWKMGCIGETPLSELATCETAQRFLRQSKRKPDACEQCRWWSLCHGGCMRDWHEEDGVLHNYYCTAFQTLFDYAGERIMAMAHAERCAAGLG